MDFLTTTILSGITYDILKQGIGFTVDVLKTKLNGWHLKEDDFEELANTLNSATETDKKTKECWEKFLNSNENIKSILHKATKLNYGEIVQDMQSATFTDGSVNVGGSINKLYIKCNNPTDDDSKKK